MLMVPTRKFLSLTVCPLCRRGYLLVYDTAREFSQAGGIYQILCNRWMCGFEFSVIGMEAPRTDKRAFL